MAASRLITTEEQLTGFWNSRSLYVSFSVTPMILSVGPVSYTHLHPDLPGIQHRYGRDHRRRCRCPSVRRSEAPSAQWIRRWDPDVYKRQDYKCICATINNEQPNIHKSELDSILNKIQDITYYKDFCFQNTQFYHLFFMTEHQLYRSGLIIRNGTAPKTDIIYEPGTIQY